MAGVALRHVMGDDGYGLRAQTYRWRLCSRNHGSASDMLTTQTYMNMAVTSIMWRYK